MSRFAARVRDPLVWTDVLQLVKTAAAAVLAWVLAVEVFSLPQSFLAPWAALLTIHATVYRTLARGLQQAAAAVVGVLLAFAAGAMLGVSWAVAGARAAGRRWRSARCGPMRAESTTAAATALVVLLTGYSDDGSMLLARLADTFVGIARRSRRQPRGLAAAARPQRRAPHRRLDDRLGALLADMAGELRERRRPGPGPLGRADARARPRHRRRLGRRPAGARERTAQPAPPRRAARPGHTRPRRRAGRASSRRSPTRAAWRERSAGPAPSPSGSHEFRDAWLAMLGRAADAVREADADGVRRVCEDLESVARRLPEQDGHGARRPVAGRAGGQPAQHPRGDGARSRPRSRSASAHVRRSPRCIRYERLGPSARVGEHP